VTAVSGRLPNERIIAVEMLRGPDHMAIRTALASIETMKSDGAPKGIKRRSG
jgi:hypothetical protein